MARFKRDARKRPAAFLYKRAYFNSEIVIVKLKAPAPRIYERRKLIRNYTAVKTIVRNKRWRYPVGECPPNSQRWVEYLARPLLRALRWGIGYDSLYVTTPRMPIMFQMRNAIIRN